MNGSGATRSIIHSGISVKQWMEALPSVDAVRPSCCPSCGCAGRPAGARIGIVGHGRRERQQRGPVTPAGPPALVQLLVRRYLCRCGAILMVVPRETQPRRLYTVSAIGWALALFGVTRLPPRRVREQTSPWKVVGATAARGWVTLRRWVHAVRAGRLLPCVRPSPADFGLRQIAERAATTVAGHAPPSSPATDGIAARAFVGAALAW